MTTLRFDVLRAAALAVATLVMVFTIPGLAAAETSSTSGAAPLSTSARLDFRIIVPRFLIFRVGTAGATIDLVEFDLNSTPLANIGDGTPTSATSGGDISPGVVTTQVVSNGGQVTITESNSGLAPLDNGVAGDTISYAEILTATSNTDLPAPVLSDATQNTALPTLNSGGITNRAGTWTYTYANNNIPEPGTYGGAGGSGNGRVTYVASTP